MKTKHLLTIYPLSLPLEGIQLEGEVPAQDLGLPEEDGRSFSDLISLRLHVAPVSGGILAQGNAAFVLRCRCDRCLTYYSDTHEAVECTHFYKAVDNEAIDLTDDVRQDILLSFPQQTLCRVDCRGLCSNCGQNLNIRDCGCEPEITSEDVWQALDNLRLPDENE